MYNLNVNVNATPASAAGLLSVAAAGEVTPRTPEIVNSLIAMTNPFDGYTHNSSGNACLGGSVRSRDRNDSSSSGGEPSPPSIQTTCSHLIKESLKLTLQTKRRVNGCAEDGKKRTRKEDGSADDEEDDESSNSKSINGLTPEDEERRRRRRERNKIAATKCRMKKREKTVILVQESETLETQNHELKSQIQELETQQKRLVDMLQLHRPTCIKQAMPQPHPQDAGYQQQQQQQQQPQPQQYADPVPQLLPSYQDNFAQMNQQQPNLADCGGIVSDYGSVKVEGFEAAFFRQQQQQQQQHQQQNPFTTASAMTTTTNVGSDANGCTV